MRPSTSSRSFNHVLARTANSPRPSSSQSSSMPPHRSFSTNGALLARQIKPVGRPLINELTKPPDYFGPLPRLTTKKLQLLQSFARRFPDPPDASSPNPNQSGYRNPLYTLLPSSRTIPSSHFETTRRTTGKFLPVYSARRAKDVISAIQGGLALVESGAAGQELWNRWLSLIENKAEGGGSALDSEGDVAGVQGGTETVEAEPAAQVGQVLGDEGGESEDTALEVLQPTAIFDSAAEKADFERVMSIVLSHLEADQLQAERDAQHFLSSLSSRAGGVSSAPRNPKPRPTLAQMVCGPRAFRSQFQKGGPAAIKDRADESERYLSGAQLRERDPTKFQEYPFRTLPDSTAEGPFYSLNLLSDSIVRSGRSVNLEPSATEATGRVGAPRIKGHKWERERDMILKDKEERLRGMSERVAAWKKAQAEERRKARPSLPF